MRQSFGETGLTSWVDISYKNREAYLHCRTQLERGEPTEEDALVILSHWDDNVIPASVRESMTAWG
jgi:hypothetical protein